MPGDDIFRVKLTAPSRDALRAFAQETGADLGCRPVARKTDAGYVIDAYMPEDKLTLARGLRADVAVEPIQNFTAQGRERQSEVGSGNRFAVRGAVPRGLGRKE